MLVNSIAIITSCLPSIRLFVVSNRNAIKTYGSYCPKNGIASVSIHSSKRPEKGSIPLDLLVENQYGHIYKDTTGILVKQDYRVESSHGSHGTGSVFRFCVAVILESQVI